jgi:hypothetical protein
MKSCPKCKTKKHNKDFHRHKNRPDKLAVWCKVCMSKYRKNLYKTKTKERELKGHKVWYKKNLKRYQYIRELYS